MNLPGFKGSSHESKHARLRISHFLIATNVRSSQRTSSAIHLHTIQSRRSRNARFDARGTALPSPRVKTRSSVDIRADRCILAGDAVEAGVAEVLDMKDNHFELGANVLFGDSHVEWVDRGHWTDVYRAGNSR
jgi:prepilin-type processing-associated H-X9-DG protein